MKQDLRHYLDSDTRRTCDGVLIMLGAAAIIIVVGLAAIRAANAQALVDMTRYDAIHGKQEITCYLDHLQYTNQTAIIHCHSDLDRIFTNGFEDLPPWTP